MAGLLDLISAPTPGRARGLLSDLVAPAQDRLRGLLSDPSGFLRAALSDVVPTDQQALEQLSRYRMPISQDYAMGTSEYDNKMRDIALGALTVYHGSPHKFDKFDMSKIGTGEGAQAYGHGLYFAERPGVAESYQRALSDATVDGKVADWSNANDVAAGWFDAFKDRTKAADYLRGQLKNTKVHSAEDLKTFKQAIDVLESGNPIGEMKPGGNLYKVDLPDESIAKMLDWDKPLSQQPDVLKAIAQAQKNNPDLAAPWMQGNYLPSVKNMTGREAYNAMAQGAATSGKQYKAGADVSNELAKYGVTGIRYLDGGSRNAGKGTYNYVVFDDTLPTILERNGQKLK